MVDIADFPRRNSLCIRIFGWVGTIARVGRDGFLLEDGVSLGARTIEAVCLLENIS